LDYRNPLDRALRLGASGRGEVRAPVRARRVFLSHGPIAYYFERAPLYLLRMAFFDPKAFREKADVYLDMIGYIRDERSRRILHELFEEWDAKAKIHEGVGSQGWDLRGILAKSRTTSGQLIGERAARAGAGPSIRRVNRKSVTHSSVTFLVVTSVKSRSRHRLQPPVAAFC
jgi:hypothetical protein